MANILDRYGIKEVADVTFYELNQLGQPTHPVLYLDTLKVSTIEQTAEESEARGGKGNSPLLIWDFGKEITVTLEDALFSAKSMAIMFGNGSVAEVSSTTNSSSDVVGTSNDNYIMKTQQFVCTTAGQHPNGEKWETPDGKLINMINPKYYTADGTNVAKANLVANTQYFVTFDVAIDGAVIEISASSFPGTYYITGDTYARSETSGKDELIWNSSLAA